MTKQLEQTNLDTANPCRGCATELSNHRHNETIQGLQVCRYCANRHRGTQRDKLPEEERFARYGDR